MGANQQSRKWNLTLNNPEKYGFCREKIIEILQRFSPEYFCLANEIGEKGTPHTHIFLYSLSPIRFATIKNRFPIAHIEKAYGTAQENKEYITKTGKWESDTKSETVIDGSFYEFGNLPTGQAEKHPALYELIEDIKEGKQTGSIIEDKPNFAFRARDIEILRQAIFSEKQADEFRTVNVTYLWGESGTGKTKSIFERYKAKDIYRVTSYRQNRVLFDGYDTQPVLVFEEFHSQIPISEMLNYLDLYPLRLPARYSDRIAFYTEVYITSNIPLNQQYKDIQLKSWQTWEAFLRRISKSIEFRKDGTIIETIVTDKGGFKMNKAKKPSYTMIRLKAGLSEMKRKKWKAIIPCIYLIFMLILWINRTDIISAVVGKMPQILTIAYTYLITGLIVFLAVMGSLCVVIAIGTPFCTSYIQDGFKKIGLENETGETPVLVAKMRGRSDKEIRYIFDNRFISIRDFNKKYSRIEVVLQGKVSGFEYEENIRYTTVYIIPNKNKLPELIEWNDSHLIHDDSSFVFGESLNGQVKISLNDIPHFLIGGTTNSGKSNLLKMVLMQAVKKDMTVFIGDFKGGVDFSKIWHKKCRIITEKGKLLDILESLVEELEHRADVFKSRECVNIDKYNAQADEKMKRIIVACDEVADLFTKEKDKEKQKVTERIEECISIICRKGRAFGLHCFLATQRPDSQILDGQIRSNMTGRICGISDSILSKIVLDSTEAAEVIPKKAKGRFLMNVSDGQLKYDGAQSDNTLFQAYLFDEKTGL